MARRFEVEPSGAMECAQALERLEAYVDGDLAAAQAGALATHLENCPACAAEHRLAVAVRRELRALPELDAPPAVIQDITLAAQRTRFAPAHRVLTHRGAWASLAAAVFATAVLGASLWWGASRQAPAMGSPTAVDPARVAQATEEARYALAYLTRVNRRAGIKLRDDLFVERVAKPTARGLSRSLSPHLDKSAGRNANQPSRDRS